MIAPAFTQHSPTIGVTIGEPAGIGPDILLMLAAKSRFARPVVAITATHILKNCAAQLSLQINIIEVSVDELKILKPANIGSLYVLNIPLDQGFIPGVPSKSSAHWVLDTIRKATLYCLHNQLGAMVTGPVHKAIINDAGVLFSGHTEFIATTLAQALKRPIEPLMMLTSGDTIKKPLRVALVTTHHPLHAVPNLITQDRVFKKINTLNTFLRSYYGIANPRILVAGLNPHAGEGGHLGLEDEQQIMPAIVQAQHNNINAIGPLPADTLFTPRHLKNADAVLAMYHDQGLPVLKYASFGDGINVTLGLPIIRTSVDHGTALDLAGTGKAEPFSLQAAINEADYILTRAHL